MMEEPAPAIPEQFWLKLEKASRSALLLDYDGTLAPFQVERDKANPYPGVREILEQIQHSDRTRLIIVSGRTVADLLPLLNMKNNPEIWGSHGFLSLFRLGLFVCLFVSFSSNDIQVFGTKPFETLT